MSGSAPKKWWRAHHQRKVLGERTIPFIELSMGCHLQVLVWSVRFLLGFGFLGFFGFVVVKTLVTKDTPVASIASTRNVTTLH